MRDVKRLYLSGESSLIYYSLSVPSTPGRCLVLRFFSCGVKSSEEPRAYRRPRLTSSCRESAERRLHPGTLLQSRLPRARRVPADGAPGRPRAPDPQRARAEPKLQLRRGPAPTRGPDPPPQAHPHRLAGETCEAPGPRTSGDDRYRDARLQVRTFCLRAVCVFCTSILRAAADDGFRSSCLGASSPPVGRYMTRRANSVVAVGWGGAFRTLYALLPPWCRDDPSPRLAQPAVAHRPLHTGLGGPACPGAVYRHSSARRGETSLHS